MHGEVVADRGECASHLGRRHYPIALEVVKGLWRRLDGPPGHVCYVPCSGSRLFLWFSLDSTVLYIVVVDFQVSGLAQRRTWISIENRLFLENPLSTFTK